MVQTEKLQRIVSAFRDFARLPAVRREPVQVPEWGELNRGYAEDSLRVLDTQLASNEFIAGPNFSWADITVVTSKSRMEPPIRLGKSDVSKLSTKLTIGTDPKSRSR